MLIKTDAIYEDGVLRPLAPLDLPEHGMVSLSISPVAATSTGSEAARQRTVLLDYISEVEAHPADEAIDQMSNRDHDRLIYGE